MGTQTSNMQHAAPTPWWKGLMIAFGLCCLILWVASWLLSNDGKPKVYEPRPHYLTKAEKREEKRRMDAEEARLGLAAQQFWTNYEEKKLAGASLETSSSWLTTSEGKHPAFHDSPPVQNTARKIDAMPSTTLPKVNVDSTSTTPLSRAMLKLYEDTVWNLLP